MLSLISLATAPMAAPFSSVSLAPISARSIFLTLACHASRERRGLLRLRSFSSGSEVVYQEEKSAETWTEAEKGGYSVMDGENDDLNCRIFRLRLPKRSATNLLHGWISEGRKITTSDLRHISKELRKSQRYAFEISERMVAHDDFKLSEL